MKFVDHLLSSRALFIAVLLSASPSGLYAKTLVSGAAKDKVASKTAKTNEKGAETASASTAPNAATSTSIVDKSWGMVTKPGIDVFTAWSLMKSPQFQKTKCRDSKLVVAVVDTGVDFTHPDLVDSRWVNEKEANGKVGVDDDGNGFIDDVNGWDFTTKKPLIVDQHGHGTHIAGIIAAHSKTSKGMLGVCPGVKIMSVRYYDPQATGQQNLLNTIESFKYAVNNGAHIINYSGGGSEFSRAEFEALKAAHMKDILVVAAAGNEQSNADDRAYYPAAYNLPNIISVTAIDQSGKLLSASNWGVKNVDIAAPGYSILSTQQNGNYGYMQGTSQATAFVTGIAALLMTEKPGTSALKIKQIIEDTGVRTVRLFKKTRTSSQANALAAIESLYKKPELPNTLKIGKSEESSNEEKKARKILSTR